MDQTANFATQNQRTPYGQGAAIGGQKVQDACAMREITVGELLDRRIDKAERVLRALQDLKGALPGNFLNSGASRISPFLEP